MEHCSNLVLPQKILKALGFLKDKRDRVKTFLIAGIYLILLSFVLFVQLIQLTNFHGDMHQFVAILEAVTCISCCIGQMFIFTCQQELFFKIFESFKLFWKSDKCSPALKNQLDVASIITRRLQITLLVGIAINCTIFILTPLLFGTIPLGVWTLHNHTMLYKALVITEMLVVLIMGSFISVTNCLFMTCCIETIIQFRILTAYFKNIDISQAKTEINKKMQVGIEHHVFIIRLTTLLQKAYSISMFVLLLTITPFACAEFYAALESVYLTAKLLYAVKNLVVLLSLCLYLIPADYVTHEALEVAQAIYDSNWYADYHSEFHKSMPFIIQRSNDKLTFKAGGLIEANSQSVVSVLKVSWSACCVLRALKRDH